MSYRYIIHNRTDGIPATPDIYTSKKKANEVIAARRQMYKDIQGYYSTSNRTRIDPDDIDYQILRIDKGSTPLETTLNAL